MINIVLFIYIATAYGSCTHKADTLPELQALYKYRTKQ